MAQNNPRTRTLLSAAGTLQRRRPASAHRRPAPAPPEAGGPVTERLWSDDDPIGLVGTTIEGRYKVLRFVSEGGYSYVYQAIHLLLKTPVALKCLKAQAGAGASQERLMERFLLEGALLTELSSLTANIVQARDVGVLVRPNGVGHMYIVLEWLEGRTLKALLSEEKEGGAPARWPLSRIVSELRPVAEALEVAHRCGVVHRDVKPSNIFFVPARESHRTRVKLLDFGIARVVTEAAETRDLPAPFTPAYGAPEQFSGHYGSTGPWTDVFALALVAAELAAGRRVMQGDDLVELGIEACYPKQRPTPRRAGVDLGPEVEAVFEKALAVDPKDRFQGAAELWTALTCAAYSSRAMHEQRSPTGTAPQAREHRASECVNEPSPHADPKAAVLATEVTRRDITRPSLEFVPARVSREPASPRVPLERTSTRGLPGTRDAQSEAGATVGLACCALVRRCVRPPPRLAGARGAPARLVSGRCLPVKSYLS